MEVNWRKVWRGDVEGNSPFYFRPFEISVPVDVMSRSNTFTIRNAFPPPETRRIPAIHYVVIKK